MSDGFETQPELECFEFLGCDPILKFIRTNDNAKSAASNLVEVNGPRQVIFLPAFVNLIITFTLYYQPVAFNSLTEEINLCFYISLFE